MIVETGCNIGLHKWYIFLSSLACIKLLVEVWRYLYVKVNYQESIVVHLGGNYLVMPVVFTAFFIYTQMMYERSNPDPERILTYREA